MVNALLYDLAKRQKENGHKLSEGSIKNIAHMLSAVFTYALDLGYVKLNPVHRVLGDFLKKANLPKWKQGKAYTLEQVVKICRLTPSRSAVAVALGLWAGMREGEIRGLRWQDVDFPGAVLHVSHSVWRTVARESTKGKEDREVRMGRTLLGMLQTYWVERGKPTDGYVLEGPKGAALNVDNEARRRIIPAIEKSDVQWLGWHALRRGHASTRSLFGEKDSDIQAELGHKDVKTTQTHYILKPKSNGLSQAMLKMDEAAESAYRTLADFSSVSSMVN